MAMTRMLCPFLLLAVVAGAVFAAAEIPGEAFAVRDAKLPRSIGRPWWARLALTTPVATGPVTYYVSDTGNDVSSGLTPDAAWQTVYRANKAMLKPGDRLLFEGGKTFTGGFNLSQVVGTADQPIVVGSYGSGRATLTPPDNITNGFLIYNCGFLEVRNLVFAGVGSTSSHGVMAVATAPGLSHLYLGMLDVSGFAVGINVQSSVASYRDVRVTWCTVHDNVNTGLYLGGSLRAALADVYVGHCESFNHPGERGYGFYLFHVANGLVERSVAHDNGGNSRLPQAFAMEEADNVTFRYCEAYRTTTLVQDAVGFLMDGGCTNSTIEYCYAHDNHGAGFQMASYAKAEARFAGNVIRYCLSVNNGVGIGGYGENADAPMADSAAYGNTIFADVTQLAKPLGQIYLLGTLSNWAVYNNLVVVSGDMLLVEAWMVSPASSVLSAGNSYYAIGATPRFQKEGVNYRTLEDYRNATGWDSFHGKPTGAIVDPKWQAPEYSARVVGIGGIDQLGESLTGWQLRADSPVVDAGIDLRAAALNPPLTPPGVDFLGDASPQGAGYDVGAFEAR